MKQQKKQKKNEAEPRGPGLNFLSKCVVFVRSERMRRYYFFSTLFPLCFAALENGKARKGHEEKRLFPFYPPVCFSPQKKSSTHLSGLMNYRWQMRYKSFEYNTQHKTKALQTTWPWITAWQSWRIAEADLKAQSPGISELRDEAADTNTKCQSVPVWQSYQSSSHITITDSVQERAASTQADDLRDLKSILRDQQLSSCWRCVQNTIIGASLA